MRETLAERVLIVAAPTFPQMTNARGYALIELTEIK